MSFLAILVLVLISFVWGSTFIVVKNAIAHIPPFLFVSLRFAIASLILIPFVIKNRFGLSDNFKKGSIAGLALFGGYTFQTFGLLFTTASKSAFITSLAIVLVPFTGFVLFRIKPLKREIFALVLAFIGLYQLILGPSFKFEGMNFGDVLTFFCALSFALHISLTGHYTNKVNIETFTFYQFVFVSLLAFVFSLTWGESFTGLGGNPLYSLLLVGVFATAFAFVGQTWAQRHIRATKTALIFSLEPVFAAIFAVIYGGEVITKNQLVGGVLILLGILISER